MEQIRITPISQGQKESAIRFVPPDVSPTLKDTRFSYHFGFNALNIVSATLTATADCQADILAYCTIWTPPPLEDCSVLV